MTSFNRCGFRRRTECIAELRAKQVIALGPQQEREERGKQHRRQAEWPEHHRFFAPQVHEEYRHMGIGTHLLTKLREFAEGKSYSGLTAQVLNHNTGMQRVFKKVLGEPTNSQSDDGETTMMFGFDK